VLAGAASVPFRLAEDAAGGIVFMEHAAGVASVRRLTSTAPGAPLVELARGPLGRLDLVRAPHRRLFLTGTARVTGSLPAVARRLDVPAGAEVSSEGHLAILPRARPSPGAGRAGPSAAWTSAMTLPAAGGGPDRARKVSLTTAVVATGERVGFELTPGVRPAAALAEGAWAHPLNAAAPQTGGTATAGSPTSPVDSDAYCSVPRNDPRTQVYQPTPRQVEWAADQAVVNNLRISRPANWKQSGLPAWTPQGLFPPVALAGGGRVPVQVLLGILSQESNLWQASGHALSGEPANPLIGNYYGVDVYDDDKSNDWDIDWSESDCGYGVSQITDGMRKAGLEKPGTPPALPASSQRAVAVDYATNIAAGLRILQSKWNETRAAGLIHANGDPAWLENWYFAIWAYNSGFHPNQGNGTPWGVGWANNPANPQYPPGRSFFNLDPHDAAHPQDWPYPEKVVGFAAFSIATLDGPGFRPAWWNSDLDRLRAKPSIYHFCTPQNNDCYSGSSFLPNCPETSCDPGTIGEPAGPCAHRNSAGYYDLKCWWHDPTTFSNCGSGVCGHELLRFDTTYPEQPDGTNYPPNCSTTGLPSGAVVVDDVPASVPTLRPCTRTWTTGGSFGLRFAADATGHYPSKIDFHQLGSGFGGHFWFAHSRWSGLATASKLEVTGTWTPPAMSGWTRIKVHLPNHGAHTQLADYTVYLGNGQTRHRVLSQNWEKNLWVDLGVYNLTSGAKVTLTSTVMANETDEDHNWDIAFDAVAFVPTSKPVVDYVALGDSYSAGEGNSPYDEITDFQREGQESRCHRSKTDAYPRMVRYVGLGDTIETRAQQGAGSTSFAFLACSGALMGAVNGDDTGGPRYWGGEAPQTFQGALNAETDLVTVTIGGDDVGFIPTMVRCSAAPTLPCEDPDMPLRIQERAGQLYRTYSAIAAKAPNARIIVFGYPRLFNPSNLCLGAIGIDPLEAKWLNDMGDLLNLEMSDAVGRVRGLEGRNIVFVDPNPRFDGHRVCEDNPYIRGFVATNLLTSYHPTLLGHAAYAALVEENM
jgi:hypothetical protein